MRGRFHSDPLCDHSLEVRARSEVLVVAVQSAPDEFERGLGLCDTPFQIALVTPQYGTPFRRLPGCDHLPDVVEPEAGFLRPQDDRDSVEVVGTVPAAIASDPRRLQQARRLPVPQDVRGQAEAFRYLADAHRRSVQA